MSQTQNTNQEASGTQSPQGPQLEQMGQQIVDEADSLSQQLEGDYDTQLEVVGDIHDTDIDTYKELLEDKYGKEGPDALAFTGDPVDNWDIKRGKEFNPEEYVEQLKDNYEVLNEIGEEFDLEIYKVHGNHDPVKGAHPGNEQGVEAIEEYAEENDEGFEDFDGNYDDFLVNQFEQLEDISYDSVELEGGMTLVGGGSHFGPEEGADPEEGLNGFLEEYDDDDWEDEEWDNLVSGSWFGLGDAINKAYKKYKDLSDEKEEYIPEDVKSEAHKDYEEKYQKIDQLLSDAGENTVVLTHGAPYGEDEDSLDFDSKKGENIGSIVWKEMLQKHDVDTCFFGHHHGGGEDSMYGTELINVGEGQGVEAGITEGQIEEYNRIEGEQVQRWGRVNKIREEGPDPIYSQIEEQYDTLEEEVEAFQQQMEENSVPSEQAQKMQRKLEQNKEAIQHEKEMTDAISTALEQETKEIERSVDTDLGIETKDNQATQGAQEPRMSPEEAKVQAKNKLMEEGMSEEEAEQKIQQKIQAAQDQQAGGNGAQAAI